MDIQKIWFNKLPEELEGYVVVVDAWAGSANMSILLEKNPRHLFIVNEDNLKVAREKYPEGLVIGESRILGPDAFLWSNEVIDMIEGDVKGKVVLWMSANGSRVFEKTIKIAKVKEVLAGSLQNASALADHLLKVAETVNIIMAGNGEDDVDEDRICAQVIEDLLKGKEVNWDIVKEVTEDAIRDYGYPEMADRNVPVMLKTMNQYKLVPKCFTTPEGYLEVKLVT